MSAAARREWDWNSENSNMMSTKRKEELNTAASTAGTHTAGTHSGHRDLPEAAERKERRDAPADGEHKKKSRT